MTQLDPYALAQSKLAALDKERDELIAFLATRPTYARLMAGVASVPEPEARAARFEAPPVAVRVSKMSTPAVEIIDKAMKILAANRAPMPLSDLYEALIANGVVIGGKDPRNNLGAKLSADPRLETHRRFGWWFKGEEIPATVLARHHIQRLEDFSNEEGPATDIARPLQLNGAADLHSA